MDANISGTEILSLAMECDEREKVIAVPVLFMMIATIGIIGNIMVCCLILFFKEYKKTIIHIYIIQLAIADFLFSFQIYFQAGSMLHGRWIYGRGWCKISEAIKMMNYYTSIIFLTVMSVDRYIAINLALNKRARKCRTKKAASIMSVCVWSIALLSVVDIIMYTDVHGCKCALYFPVGNRETQLNSLPDLYYDDSGESDYYGSGLPLDQIVPELRNGTQDWARSLSGNQFSPYFKTRIFCNFILAFVFPLIIICMSYGLILRRTMKPTPAIAGCKSPISSNLRRRVTRTVIGLVTLFVICWLPYHSFNLARLNDLKLQEGAYSTVQLVTVIFAYCNSALNPFFYICMSRNFRKSMVNAVGRVRENSQQLKGAVRSSLPSSSKRETKMSSLSAKSREDVSINSLERKATVAVLNDNEIEDDDL